MDEEIFGNSIPGTAPPIFRGVVKRKHIHQHLRDKKDFYYMDTGYFGNFTSPGNPSGKKLFHRIVKNDLQKHWLENTLAIAGKKFVKLILDINGRVGRKKVTKY
jgi:hypothetical protein